MKRMVFLFSLAFASIPSPCLAQVTLARWDFPQNPDDALVDFATPANANAVLSTSAAGTPTFSHPGLASQCAGATGWRWDLASPLCHPRSWQVVVSTQGFVGIVVSSRQRSDSLGPRDFKLQYSVDCQQWVDVQAGSIRCDQGWSTGSIVASLPAEVENRAVLGLRWTTTSNISVSGGTIDQTADSFIDDIVISSEGPLPVTLASFGARVAEDGVVCLEWTTLTELANYGFFVERSVRTDGSYAELPNGFVPGSGTTTEPRHYRFVDRTASPGRVLYRLRQQDLDGTVHWTDPVSVDVPTSADDAWGAPSDLVLEQNYPNPFNPGTEISFSIGTSGSVTISVFDQLGRRVAVLLDEVRQAGRHSVRFDAGDLAAGTYIARMHTGARIMSIRMVLVK